MNKTMKQTECENCIYSDAVCIENCVDCKNYNTEKHCEIETENLNGDICVGVVEEVNSINDINTNFEECHNKNNFNTKEKNRSSLIVDKASDKNANMEECQNENQNNFVAKANTREDNLDNQKLINIEKIDLNKTDDILKTFENGERETDFKNVSKFKNIEALESAYINLEKEFTKKCQKIKELEKDFVDNALAPAISKQEAIKQVIAKLGEKFSAAKYFAEDIAKVAENEDIMQDNKAEEALLNILSNKYLPSERLSENEEFLNNFIYSNEKIRRVMVDNYLEEIDGRKIPKCIGGGKIVVTPSARPKTIAEAGAITLNIIKNRRNN